MATKSIACPECGAAVAPGRYACAECGALVAALGTVPRTWASVAADVDSAVPPPVVPARPREAAKRVRRPKAPVNAAPPPAMAAPSPEVESPAPRPGVGSPTKPSDVAPPSASPVAAVPRVAIPSPELDDDARREAAAIDEDRPLAAHAAPPPRSARSEPHPGSLAAILAPDASERSGPPPIPLVITPPPAAADRVPSADSRGAPLAANPATAPVWPPAGDSMPAVSPPVRTPAGSYLAPSAVLPPLDAPLSEWNGHAGSHNGHVHGTTSRGPADAGPNDAAVDAGARVRATLGESLETFGITAEMPRRLVGGGAAIAGLGFLLPWIDALGGTGALLDSYLDYWGLSGPGHWIVAAALTALVAASLATGPLARLPVGAIGIAFSGVLVGLLWPYLFGIAPKSVGVWIVLAGTFLMAAGGVVELRRRHATPDPGV